ncbi:helix-turn-helix domain-containing protein [Actinomadura sp. NPDC048021]|uniref:helix-turn-helix domain-containing protein n=1 Tax=Actinomadura sp. NPDC048021 TaxID=3155385 RepID=UPI0033EBB475
MPAPAPMISEASTVEVAPRDRIGFWEDYNRRALVGLSCTSYSERGLLARQANFRLGTAREGALVVALRAVLENPEARSRGNVLDLLRMIATERSGGRSAPAAYQTQLIVAEDYVERHLHDPGLTPGEVASVLGVSVRHLGRIFETAGTTPARHILERRLQRARDELASPAAARTTIADVAYRWGFSSQAHFARRFRARFGLTPSEARAASR